MHNETNPNLDKFIQPLDGRPGKFVIDLPKIKSYNADWLIINSGRGPGKTFGVLRDIMLDICKNLGDKQMILVARRLNELRQATEDNGDRFLGDVWIKTPFLNENFVYRKRKEFFIEIAKRKFTQDGEPLPDKELEWYTAVNLLYLSGAIRRSVAYNKVDYILFDEFQIVDGGLSYVRGEYRKFMNLLSTVFRDREAKVYMLSNSGSIINPYYDGIGYKDPEQEVWTRTIKMDSVDNNGEKFIKPVKLAVFNLKIDPNKLRTTNIAGAFGAEEDFSGDYGVSSDFIGKLNDSSRIQYNFSIENEKYSWYKHRLPSGKVGVFIAKGFNNNAKFVIADTFMLGDSLRDNAIANQLKVHAKENTLLFDSITTREKLIDFINKLY